MMSPPPPPPPPFLLLQQQGGEGSEQPQQEGSIAMLPPPQPPVASAAAAASGRRRTTTTDSTLSALSALYVGTAGSTSWASNANWMNGDPCDNSWFGVTCSSGDVTQLDLNSNKLKGALPTVDECFSDPDRYFKKPIYIY